MRLDLTDQFDASRRYRDVEGAAVSGILAASDQSARFESVNQAGDVRAVHDELAAELDLGAAFGHIVEETEGVELAGAEVPAGEEDAARVPERLGGAQEFDEGVVSRPRL